jgi:TonB family protein
MATPTIEPPQNAPQLPSPGDRNLLRNRPVPSDPEEFHMLIAELRDEASRSRMREAVWISIIFHMLLIFTLHQSPKWWPTRSVTLLTPEQIAQREKNNEIVFSEQPKDSQQVKVKPNTNKISDKDRIASTKNPNIDRRTLERLANNRREGSPGMNPQQPFAPPPQPQPQTQGGQPTPQQMASATQPQRPNTNPNALEQPQSRPQPNRNIFGNARPSTSAIDQAVREAARNRGGIGGEYGGGPGRVGNAMKSDVEILSDTMGVDFAPYIQRMLQSVRTNWYPLVPESVNLGQKGTVVIEFVIGKNGKVTGMRLRTPSGSVPLDRAAWGGITGSNPFAPLPTEFRGDYIVMAIKFMYNPDQTELK